MIDYKEKCVLIRVDINSPVVNGKIAMNDRIIAHAKTIKDLAKKGAKVVVLAHQGRPGDEDFLDLEQHAKLLTRLVRKNVKYVDDLYGEKAIKSINDMKPGDIILLKNVRSIKEEMLNLSPEEHAKSAFVKTLAPLFDYFIQDAFSVCHRSHASVVGFPFVLPSYAGPMLEKELSALKRIGEVSEATFILGGAKPEECIALLKYATRKKKNKILTTGVFSLYCLSAAGYKLGEEEKILDKRIVEELKGIEQVIMPIDFAVEGEKSKRKEISLEDLPTEKLIFDIGKRTIKEYKKIIEKSKIIFLKGPAGKYEDKRFQLGTREIFKAVAESKAFSIVGGGNTIDAINKFKILKSKFSHISLGGGALIDYIAGEKMPGIEVLNK
ncbi:MAG: phosphoglycerate kinase [Candidatus Aenigmatarchaeota archaeon]